MYFILTWKDSYERARPTQDNNTSYIGKIPTNWSHVARFSSVQGVIACSTYKRSRSDYLAQFTDFKYMHKCHQLSVWSKALALIKLRQMENGKYIRLAVYQ